jgi:hypothetical protein
VATNIQKYLQFREALKKTRQQESELLDKMDLLWQAMTLEEREEIRRLRMSWPPPALMKEDEDTDGNA